MRGGAIGLALVLLAGFAAAQWPDRGGYRWLDSDTSAGPAFDWLDISGCGTRLLLGDDDNLGPFPLGFRFRFYGRAHDSVRVCSNGWLSFTSSSHQFHHYHIPDTRDPNSLLAALWLDLDPEQGGAVYSHADTVNRRFVVSWVNVAIHDTTDSCTFQVVLDSSSVIEFRYLALPTEMQVGGYPSTVGIEDDSGLVGSEYLYDNLPVGNRLHDSLAIRFYQLEHDVGPELILRPWHFSLAGESIKPLVRVWNPGTEPATFPVELRIGTGYDEQVSATLGALADTLLQFPVWVPGEDSYPIQAFTLLAGDEFTANDTVHGFTCGSYIGQLRYDDGDPDTWFLRNGAPTVDWAAAVRFTSPYERFRLLRAMLFLADTQPFERVLVCPDSAGKPRLGSPYFTADSVGVTEPETWLELGCDTAVTREGDIWLVAFWPRRATGPQIGDDRSEPLDGRSYFGSSLTGWIRHTAGDLLARLVVDGRLGVGEAGAPNVNRPVPGATIVRGEVWIEDRVPETGYRAELLDISGRKVMALVPGANDVRHLAPGVYFVRQASGVERDASSVRKVVIQN